MTEATPNKPSQKLLRRAGLSGLIVGAVVWGFFAALAAVMLVSMGAWAWVVWPFAAYWYIGHLGRAGKAYTEMVNPKKWEQNVTINVPAEMTAEQLSAAAARAVNERLTYSL